MTARATGPRTVLKPVAWVAGSLFAALSAFAIGVNLVDADEASGFKELHGSFPSGASTVDELVSQSDAVVRVEPVAAKEILLIETRTEQPTGTLVAQVWAQPMRVVESMTGDLKPGTEINVTRFTAELDGEDAVAEEFQGPFGGASYILGLDYFSTGYKVPVWVPLGGPGGAVPLSGTGDGATVVVEVDTPLQVGLEGKSASEVRGEISSAESRTDVKP